MAKIVTLTQNDETVYPVTKPEAVVDANGQTIVEKIAAFGGTSVTWDNSGDDYLVIELGDLSSLGKGLRIDMSATYSGGSEANYVGSLLIGGFNMGTPYLNGYYYGDDISDLVTSVKLYSDTDSNSFLIISLMSVQTEEVTFTIFPLNGGVVTASLVSDISAYTEDATATITTLGAGSSDVFVATYGTTTAAEVSAAIAANKVVICWYNGREYVYANKIGVNYYFNSWHGVDNCYSVRVSDSNQWADSGLRTFETTSSKVSTISGNETSTTRYPNTKAVYDYVSGIVGDIETLLAAI